MDKIVFAIIQLLGGLTFFLYGMRVMSKGLEKSTNGNLNQKITKFTKKRFVAMLFGAGLTIAVQSSSAVTVILVGLVNSGIIEFGQTIGILMGSNIGTTLTTWLTSLAGIDSNVFWMQLLKPDNFAPVFAFIGIILIFASKKKKQKEIGNILVGFAVLMFGMSLMSDSMKPLAEMEGFKSMLIAFTNPILAVLAGAVFTGLIQSSAASVAILQALSISGGITYSMAVPIIMGQNIGTCATVLISSVGVSRNAKKVAVVHLSFNIIGTIVMLVPFYLVEQFVHIPFLEENISPIMIAVVHSVFNIVTTMLLLPFTKQLEKIANLIIPEKNKKGKQAITLDSRLLTVPSVAVEEALNVAATMCRLSQEALQKSTLLIDKYDDKAAQKIFDAEQELDNLEDQLGSFMMKLTKIGATEENSKKITRILHTINDFERIGDHAVNIVTVAEEMNSKKIHFSSKAKEEITILNKAVLEILEITVEAFCNNDCEKAMYVEPLEQVVDDLVLNIKSKHIIRLQNGECTISLGFVLSDLLTSYRRVSDHCSNIAVAVLEASNGTFETHKYLGLTKHRSNVDFEALFKQYKDKYILK